MQYKFPVVAILAALMALVVSSCTSNEVKDEASAEVAEPIETVEPLIVAPIEVTSTESSTPVFSERDALLQVDTFYFDYDSSDLAIDSDDALDIHAEELVVKLGDNPNAVVTVEGHADERGTIEYNNALSNRRAEAVSQYLQAKGVPSRNIETISYGELKPVVEGQDETSWALNRRVVVDY